MSVLKSMFNGLFQDNPGKPTPERLNQCGF